MTAYLLDRLHQLGYPRVLVVGDLMLDRYVTGDVERLSPEAPIPVLSARATEERLGGAGNVAANLRAMDAEVEILGIIGADEHGKRLQAMFGEIGADATRCVVDPDRPTTEKTRLLTGMHQLLRVDWERTGAMAPDVEERLAAAVREGIARANAVVLSDYDKGALSTRVLEVAIEAGRAHGVPVCVDPKGDDYRVYRGATLVTPNKKEAELAVGRQLTSLEDVPVAAQELLDTCDLDAAVITLGPDGMYHLSRDRTSGRVPTFARAVFDVTGAGDTVISHLALALGDGLLARGGRAPREPRGRHRRRASRRGRRDALGARGRARAVGLRSSRQGAVGPDSIDQVLAGLARRSTSASSSRTGASTSSIAAT